MAYVLGGEIRGAPTEGANLSIMVLPVTPPRLYRRSSEAMEFMCPACGK